MKEQIYYVVATEHAKNGFGLITEQAYKREKWTCPKMFEGNFEDSLKEKKKLVNIKNNS